MAKSEGVVARAIAKAAETTVAKALADLVGTGGVELEIKVKVKPLNSETD